VEDRIKIPRKQSNNEVHTFGRVHDPTIFGLAGFALLMGFALGGSLFWGAFGPNVTQHGIERSLSQDTEPEPRITKEENDAALVRYTLWLAILTGGLVFVSAGQGFFLLRADKTARITADAAQAQTHNFTKLERPYVYVFNPKGLKLEDYTEDPYHYFEYEVANYGKTPATIEAVLVGISVGKLPAEPYEVGGWHNLLQTPIMIPDEKRTELRVHISELIAITEYADEDTAPTPVPELSGDDEFYFRVVITYRGPFSRSHETSACWRWKHLGFVSFDDDRFTYIR
jgi:hypothetical protein